MAHETQMAQRQANMAPRGGQDGAKRAPREAKRSPDGTQMGPRWSQEGAKRGQDGPRWGQDGAQMGHLEPPQKTLKNKSWGHPRFRHQNEPNICPKAIRSWVQFLINFGTLGVAFGDILGAIWPQDWPRRRRREPTRVPRSEKDYFRKNGFRIGPSAFFRS